MGNGYGITMAGYDRMTTTETSEVWNRGIMIDKMKCMLNIIIKCIY